jgi:hypothetical protein
MSLVIIIGNKTGKGNGERIIASDSSAVLDAVQILRNHPRIRICAADEWICDECHRSNRTKLEQTQCGYCRKIGRKFDSDGMRVFKNKSENIESMVRDLLIKQGKCTKCGLVLSKCKCE